MMKKNTEVKSFELTWFGHSCFRIVSQKSIHFFDPVRSNKLLGSILEPENVQKPQTIFISHEHWDHCDPITVFNLCSESTMVFGPQSIENPLIHEMTFNAKDLDDLKQVSQRISIVKPDDLLHLKDIRIRCLPAQEGLSYLLLFGEKKLLFMGDSHANSEMIKESPDIILFPIWAVKGEEAKLNEFLTLAKDALCIPMHYHESPGALPNFYVDMNEVEELLENVNMKILKRGEPIKV